MNQRTTWILAIILGGLAVGLGAFGAHALETMLEARERTDTWDLAVHYQMFHALAMLFTGTMIPEYGKWFRIAAVLLFTGILCFSGSLYVLCLSEMVFPLVLITPLGGVLLMAGWGAMLTGLLSHKKQA